MPMSIAYINPLVSFVGDFFNSPSTSGFILGLTGNPILAQGATNGFGTATTASATYPTGIFYVTLPLDGTGKNLFAPNQTVLRSAPLGINGFIKAIGNANAAIMLPDSAQQGTSAPITAASAWSQPNIISQDGSNLASISFGIQSTYLPPIYPDVLAWNPGTCLNGGVYIPWTNSNYQIQIPIVNPYGSGISSHDMANSYEYSELCGDNNPMQLNLSSGWSDTYNGYYAYTVYANNVGTTITLSPIQNFFGF
jgi:hypothetical protein